MVVGAPNGHPRPERRQNKRGWSIITLTVVTLGVAAFLIAAMFMAVVVEQHSNSSSVTDRAFLLATVGLIGSLVLFTFVGYYLLFNVMRPVRVVARAARRVSDGQLDTRVPERGRGEIRTLSHSFNRMAGALQDRSRELTQLNLELESSIESAEEGSRLKSAFLANISHEIRTPLNGLMGITTILKQTELDPEQQEYLRAARASGDALLAVINDVLDFSKIEAGRLEVDPHDFELPQAIDAVCDLLVTAARQKGLRLHTHIDPGVPKIANGDRGRLMQILTNLTANAIKFSSDGDVVVEVARGSRDSSGIPVVFKVKDSGIGISDEAQKTLFDAFTQADVSTTRRFGGTGLGLAISYELARLMGGSIEVESEVGVGSVFTLELPFGEPRGEEAATASVMHTGSGPDTRSGQSDERCPGTGDILIAEDNEINRFFLSRVLAERGLVFEIVSNGRQALEILANPDEVFDLVLMDCQMPEIDGYDATRKLRAREIDQDLPRTPVIAMTAHAMEGDREKCLAAGMDDYLAKPLQLEELDRVLGEWLKPKK